MTEPKTYTISQAILPIGDIALYTQDGKKFILDPKDDITALESVRLSTLLTFMATATFGTLGSFYDWQGYVNLHGLQRHLREV